MRRLGRRHAGRAAAALGGLPGVVLLGLAEDRGIRSLVRFTRVLDRRAAPAWPRWFYRRSAEISPHASMLAPRPGARASLPSRRATTVTALTRDLLGAAVESTALATPEELVIRVREIASHLLPMSPEAAIATRGRGAWRDLHPCFSCFGAQPSPHALSRFESMVSDHGRLLLSPGPGCVKRRRPPTSRGILAQRERVIVYRRATPRHPVGARARKRSVARSTAPRPNTPTPDPPPPKPNYSCPCARGRGRPSLPSSSTRRAPTGKPKGAVLTHGGFS